MPENQLRDIIISTVFGSATRALYNYKNKLSLKNIILNLLLSIMTIFPAYLLVCQFELNSYHAMIIGYCFGILGERIIIYIMKKHEVIFDSIIFKRMND